MNKRMYSATIYKRWLNIMKSLVISVLVYLAEYCSLMDHQVPDVYNSNGELANLFRLEQTLVRNESD